MPLPITKRQKEVLDFIKKFISKKKYPPTLEEICAGLKLSAVSTVHQHIKTLAKKGYLKKAGNNARAIDIYESEPMIKVPLLGTIAAGQPIEAIENKEIIAVPKSKIPASSEVYALRVVGDSMIDENINNGDIVLVRQQTTANNGQKVVALIDNHEATLKKFYKEKGQIRLQPANKSMEPLIFRSGRDVAIQGIVIDVIQETGVDIPEIITEKKQNSETLKSDAPIRKYEQDYTSGKTVRIVQDDCIRFLKKLDDHSIDLITTDPAYSGMNNHLMLHSGRIVGKYADKGKENGRWFAEFQDTEENYKEFLAECKRVLKKDTGHLYIMFDSFSLLSLAPLMRKYFDVKNVIVWDKVNVGMGHYFRRQHEFIMFATNSNKRKLSSKSIPDVWKIKRIHNAQYPTQKPVEVFDMMIKASAGDNYTICDPFLGSGSSAIAAIKAKCNFIGCDISNKAFDVSENRIKTFLSIGNDPLQANGKSVNKKEITWPSLQAKRLFSL
ncbi:MAG: repressor LexA [Candidatus Staskawiczbacteria bacterium RIFCSPLOWO2_01_FULL_40_39]|uniref:LexA repressor n=1 Tax=Candidatus Staskawiczbacteria bacterium RIFCSPHIGHO2_01_FULL_39_25 TaxID=1802202 RepID=A0A1G2HS36_9BACT|nr:MAG: repressor LexA [Candidatus Staskawiczbacteria bacterium RIFCSPHIGHO2_01_FULL_39_25]OGZ72706.1 MAG: repressor LexA [Candidatus Staskawiczbacteria bacterium RIFCSPLOWO2_01_FULL_40_39]OGZ74701.1 MAG: repressor LexA [Candidatus Staskawiczbacteria bacterium RIFCSPLOWO2_02_FULL_39_8]